MRVIWGERCKANQQLLSITSAPSGVISKQTDWNRPTEASSRGTREGWTEEKDWKQMIGGQRDGEGGIIQLKRWRMRFREAVRKIRQLTTTCYSPPHTLARTKVEESGWVEAACRIVRHATGNSNHLLSFTFSPFPWHPSSCSLPPSYPSFPSPRLTEQATPVRVKMKGLRGSWGV